MKRKSAHEPKAKLMSTAEVWDDAQQIAAVLRQPQPAIHDIKVNGAQDIVQDVREGSCFLSSERGEGGLTLPWS